MFVHDVPKNMHKQDAVPLSFFKFAHYQIFQDHHKSTNKKQDVKRLQKQR